MAMFKYNMDQEVSFVFGQTKYTGEITKRHYTESQENQIEVSYTVDFIDKYQDCVFSVFPESQLEPVKLIFPKKSNEVYTP